MFYFALGCAAQNQGKQKVCHTKTSVSDTVSFDYITPEGSSEGASKQNNVYMMKSSASDETNSMPVNNTTTDNSSKSTQQANVPKLSSGVEEEKLKPSPK